ncbi:hypothetical protein JCM10212_006380 [Sporobolomyces blumeae]
MDTLDPSLCPTTFFYAFAPSMPSFSTAPTVSSRRRSVVPLPLSPPETGMASPSCVASVRSPVSTSSWTKLAPSWGGSTSPAGESWLSRFSFGAVTPSTETLLWPASPQPIPSRTLTSPPLTTASSEERGRRSSIHPLNPPTYSPTPSPIPVVTGRLSLASVPMEREIVMTRRREERTIEWFEGRSRARR